jgi:hypothetical protein
MKFFVFDPETKKDFGISQFPTGANRNIAHTVPGWTFGFRPPYLPPCLVTFTRNGTGGQGGLARARLRKDGDVTTNWP